ncbi:putative amino acid permease YhdG [Rubripirellula lacrimiformis]|uniref:Putative amino acid permease YhdG n=1 Tax=Rubripirellula lacrimiformis TaxID=1930273 RepID=A0A517NKN5_9BACT|nr:amino acid permease [Rubripirellula lacrimiformis]QDT07702.1 putative amino acid permease YhdG [Rubripirellula lacrimiformis]
MTDTQQRHLGLFGATGIGVGAIVGGGILALAGVAFATTGPAAIVAFAINGVIAMLTALSFAEMASKFPESGGTYTFSRKVLSVESAFTVGWVVWFASIVAAVLYALGFAHFGLIFCQELSSANGYQWDWLHRPILVPVTAIATSVLLAVGLMMRTGGGGTFANVAKVAVFVVLIVGGVWAVCQQSAGDTVASFRPFFADGMGGLVQAMGYSFIALQGFDLIAAVGGEIKQPARTIPRAMMLSLVIALLIYLPLLSVIVAVGTPSGESITEAAAADPGSIVANAARNYLGVTGFWLVIVAAVLSMFTALQANLFAASRIAQAMAGDRTLPRMMSRVSAGNGNPTVSVIVTTTLVCLLVVALPDLSAAGAASSLIFLVTFAIAHWLSVLVRQRSPANPPPFMSPWYPVVPVVGGLACVSLAVFQGIAVPTAGLIAVVWLSLGGVLFLTLFARSARLRDVSSMAANPELSRLRGNTPLVLVPIANPQNAEAMIALAETLVPAALGRVLLHTVVVAPPDWAPDLDPGPADRSHVVQRALISASLRLGVHAETLVTVAASPFEEIARVARLHRCGSVLLGLSEIAEDGPPAPMEALLSRLETDVVVLRAPNDWHLAERQKILVPVAGHGGHDYLLTRLLGSLTRNQNCDVKFVRVIPVASGLGELRRVEKELDRLAYDNFGGRCEREVVESDDPVDAVVSRADASGLVILGVQRIGPRQKLFGRFTRQIASRTHCPIIVISRRG